MSRTTSRKRKVRVSASVPARTCWPRCSRLRSPTKTPRRPTWPSMASSKMPPRPRAQRTDRDEAGRKPRRLRRFGEALGSLAKGSIWSGSITGGSWRSKRPADQTLGVSLDDAGDAHGVEAATREFGAEVSMIRQFELVERVKAYDPGADEDTLNRAYVFSMKAHGSQSRASGDPYFSHPLGVAEILTRLKLDTASIVTGLLHDTVEDTEATLEEIEELFGAEIGRLVDGVTKLSRLELQSDNTKHAENFRKLVLAMSNDIRVLLVKLADRLHNMQTLHYIKAPEKRRRIAVETMEIYAPLAERMGMHQLKDELENLAFAEVNPDAYQSITQRLQFLREQGTDLCNKVVAELEKVLKEQEVACTVSGREKTPYSIWRKMQKKQVEFEQLSDIIAFRVMVEDVPDCYQALGVLHSSYSMIPGRFKDFISTPKPNNYQSLHTGIIGPHRLRIEVQIRTRKMHDVAEMGVAAHWGYKQGLEKIDGRQY